MFQQVSVGKKGRGVGPACRTELYDMKNGTTIGRVVYPPSKVWLTKYPIQLRDFDVELRLVRPSLLGVDVPLPFQRVDWDANTTSEAGQRVLVAPPLGVMSGSGRTNAFGRLKVQLRDLPISGDWGYIVITFRHMMGNQEISRTGLSEKSPLIYAQYSNNYVGRFCEY